MKNVFKQKTAYILALLLVFTTVFSGGFALPSLFEIDVHAATSVSPSITESIEVGDSETYTLHPNQKLYLEFEPSTTAKYKLKVTSSNDLKYHIKQGSKSTSGTSPTLTTAKLTKNKEYKFTVYYEDTSVASDKCTVKLSKDSSSSDDDDDDDDSSSSSSSSSKSSGSSSSSSSSSKSSGSSSSSSSSKTSSTAKGNTYKVGKANYTITGTSTVCYDGAQMTANATVAEVPATVTLASKTYTVNAIGPNAFAGYNKLKKVVVGENVKNLRAGAFADAASLTTINIHSTDLSMATTKDALKNSNVKRVLVPISSLKDYKKIFSKSHSGSANSIQVRRNNYTPASAAPAAATGTDAAAGTATTDAASTDATAN